MVNNGGSQLSATFGPPSLSAGKHDVLTETA
jgi:hypothetical protein